MLGSDNLWGPSGSSRDEREDGVQAGCQGDQAPTLAPTRVCAGYLTLPLTGSPLGRCRPWAPTAATVKGENPALVSIAQGRAQLRWNHVRLVIFDCWFFQQLYCENICI